MVDWGFVNIGLAVCNLAMFFGMFHMYLRIEKIVLNFEEIPMVKPISYTKKEKKSIRARKNRVITHSEADLYKKEMEKSEDPS